LPETLVWDRQSGLHGGGGRPTAEFAGFCGALKVGWYFCERGDPQAKGVVERLQDFIERSFEPGRCFANELDYQLQLDAWFDERANPRLHRTLRARPIDRLIEERTVMAPLPAVAPETDRRWVLRVPADPYLRFDTCDYSLDPGLVGRRVEVRVSAHEVSRSRWTAASWPAGTRGRSPGTARSPRSSTHARSRPNARNAAASRSSRFARSRAMTS